MDNIDFNESEYEELSCNDKCFKKDLFNKHAILSNTVNKVLDILQSNNPMFDELIEDEPEDGFDYNNEYHTLYLT